MVKPFILLTFLEVQEPFSHIIISLYLVWQVCQSRSGVQSPADCKHSIQELVDEHSVSPGVFNYIGLLVSLLFNETVFLPEFVLNLDQFFLFPLLLFFVSHLCFTQFVEALVLYPLQSAYLVHYVPNLCFLIFLVLNLRSQHIRGRLGELIEILDVELTV